MYQVADGRNAEREFRLAAHQESEFDGWASGVVAAAVKIIWALPVTPTTNEVRRRIARAEAIRINRRQRRSAPPVPESPRPTDTSVTADP